MKQHLSFPAIFCNLFSKISTGFLSSACFLIVFPTVCFGQSVDVTGNLIHNYSFDTDYTDATGKGSTGTEYANGTLNSTGEIATSNSKIGTGYLNLTGGYVSLGDNSKNSNFGISTAMSSTMWVKAAVATSNYPAFISNKDWYSWKNPGVILDSQYNNGAIGACVGSVLQNGTTGVALSTNDTWQFIGFTAELGTKVQVFAGDLQGGLTLKTYSVGTSTNALTSSYAWNIGREGGTRYANFNGGVDELTFYNAALSYKQIVTLYNAGLAGIGVKEIGTGTSPVRSTSADGSWYNTATWNNQRVPLGDETLNISRAVTAEAVSWCGNMNVNSSGSLTVAGGTTFYYLSGQLNQTGGTVDVKTSGTVYYGCGLGAEFDGTISAGTFKAACSSASKSILLGSKYSSASLTVENNASASFSFDSNSRTSVYVGASGGSGTLTVKDNASLSITATYLLVGGANGTGKVYLTGNSVNTFKTGIWVGTQGVDDTDVAKNSFGDGYIEITGGTNTFQSIDIAEKGTTKGKVYINGGNNVISERLALNSGTSSEFTFENGTLSIGTVLNVGSSVSTFNRIGGLGTISAQTMTAASGSHSNFLINSSGLGTVTVTGTATLNGNINAEQTGGFVNTKTNSYNAISAASIAGTPTVQASLWTISVVDNNCKVDLNSDYRATVAESILLDISNEPTTIELKENTGLVSGWIALKSSDWEGEYTLNLSLTGLNELNKDDFLTFIEDGLKGNDALSAQYAEDESALTITGLSFDSTFLDYISWDFASFNQASASTVMLSGLSAVTPQSLQVPEPASFVLLIMGAICILRLAKRQKSA